MRVRLVSKDQPNINNRSLAPSALQQSNIGRNLLRSGAVAAESTVGLPGDIAQGVNTIASYLPQHEKPSGINQLLESALPKITGTISNILPTQESLRKNVTEPLREKANLPSNYLKPQGEWEKLSDDFISLLAPSIATGGGSTLKAVSKTAGGIASGLAGKEVAKKLGAGPFGQTVAQLGFSFLPGFLGNERKVEKLVTDNYDAAKKAGEKQLIPAEKLWNFNQKNLGKVIGGQPEAFKKEAQEQLLSLDTAFQGTSRKIPVNEAVDRVQSLNRLARDRQYDERARNFFKITAKELDDTIMDYAKNHPKFGKPYELAKKGWQGLKERSALEEYLKETIDLANFKSPLTQVAYGALGSGSYLTKGLVGLGTTGAAVAGAAGIREGHKVLTLLRRSKLARDIYMDSIKNAALRNKSALLKNVKNFDLIAHNYEREWKEKPTEQKNVRVRLVR